VAAAPAWHAAFADGVSTAPIEARTVRVGLVSDTHGLMRPEALDALAGSDAIVHAGDVGSADVLQALARIAPVHAVRGNNDGGAWAAALPQTLSVEIAGTRLFVLHDLATLDFDPHAMDVDAVVSGHSQRPTCETRKGILFVNPGSAGPRRFRLPVTLARLSIGAARLHATILTLAVASPPAKRRAQRQAQHGGHRP
jgi:putative phosphoesterase